MSTRCNIIIKDDTDKLFFYRHSDGYPEETGKDLKQFVKGYTDGKYRDNVGQSAGWLIIWGRKFIDRFQTPEDKSFYERIYGWKVGDYEPTTDIHGDIDYLYEIDLTKRKLTTFQVRGNKQSKLGSEDF